MPASITVHPDARLGVVRLSGVVTGQEIADAAADLAARQDWESHYRVIWDTLGVTELDVPMVSFEAILDQERRFRERGEDGDLVFVVDDEVWASLVTLFSHRMREAARSMIVVRTLGDALARLGVEDV